MSDILITVFIAVLLSPFVAMAAMIFMSLLEHRFESNRFTRDYDGGRKLTRKGWVEIFGVGVLYGAMMFLNIVAPVWTGWSALLSLLLSVLAAVYICTRWARDSARPGILSTVWSFVLVGGAIAIAISSARIMVKSWSAVPQIIILILVWSLIPVSVCWVLTEQFYAMFDSYNAKVIAANARHEYKAAKAAYKKAISWLWAARVTIVLKVISVVLIIIFTISSITALWAGANATAGNGTSTATTVATEPATEPATVDSGGQLEQNWLTYQQVVEKYSYLDWNNFWLQSNGNPDDNTDFGPDRRHDGWTAFDYLVDMKTYEQNDLPILISHIGATSAATKTDLAGDYYNGNDCDWSRTLNAMVVSCLDGGETNRMHLLEVFQNFMNNEIRGVKVVHMDDVHDQMRIDPYTYDGIPKIVVSTTHQSGEILLVTFRTKGGTENDVTVGFRINCCYQPIGVIDLMDMPDTQLEIPPEYTPGGSSSNGGKNSGEQPTTTPTPTPTTTPSGSKNPADVNNGNADKGGGDNRSSGGSGEYQSEGPRNNGGQAGAKTPQTPTVDSGHSSDDIVDHQDPPNYEPDPVTSRGPVDSKPPTSSNGDGEFVPAD